MLAALLAALVLAACGGAGATPAPSTATVTVDPLTETVPDSRIPSDTPVEPGVLRIVGAPSLSYDLVQIALGQGFFGKEGLGVRLTPARTRDAVLEALRAGRADGALVESADALRMAAADADLRIVLILASVTTDAQIVAGPTAPDIASLAGRRVAYEPGGSAELLLRSALDDVAVPFDAITDVPLDGRSPGTRLAEGAADAAVVGGVQASSMLGSGGGFAAIATAGDHPGLISQVLVVRSETARTRPGQVLAFIRGWQDLYLYERDETDAVIAEIATEHGLNDRDVAERLAGVDLLDVPGNAVDLLPGGEYYDRTIGVIARVCHEAGWVPENPDPQRLIDGSFAQAVASAR